ncbi:hypothetical protein O9993_19435 [Vibrio lentus]|nr:hypothetical protein [Vibrio lentus]
MSQLAELLFVSERHVQTTSKRWLGEGWVGSGRRVCVATKALLTCSVEPIDVLYAGS